MRTIDRIVRAFVIAPALVAAAVRIGRVGVASIVLYAIAGVMLTTAGIGFCPPSPAGTRASTCRTT